MNYHYIIKKEYLINTEKTKPFLFYLKALEAKLSLTLKLQYLENLKMTVVVCSGFTLLSTIFQSYHNGVWLRQGAQCSLL